MDFNDQTWTNYSEHGSFVVSTKISLLDRPFINRAFSTDEMHWAVALPPDQLETMLAHSVTYGLYEDFPAAPQPATVDEPASPRDESPTLEAPPAEKLKQVGIARLLTDRITFAYLTDVYIQPEYRGKQLAKWLIACVKETVQAHPHLRRFALLTSSPRLVDFYKREMGAWEMQAEPGLVFMSGKLT